jgi:hypothetical protein
VTLRGSLVALALAALGPIAWPAQAEPYIAVHQGYQCGRCHVNPTGGGMRNEFGNIYAQNVMPAHTLDTGDATWSGQVNRFVAVGGDMRADWTWTEVPHESTTNEAEVTDARLYLMVQPIPGRLAVYVDERVAPGSATNLEAYARYWSADARWFAQAGRMYLPFGLRLEDDSALTRRAPGINMTAPDEGVEIGWESAHGSAQFAVSNGSAGGPETDSGKQWTGNAVYVESLWRLGIAASYNNSDAGNRTAGSLYGGVRTGPVAWLAEAVIVDDQGFPDGARTLTAALLEANWIVRKGHNLKLTAEWFDPDRDVAEDEQTRWSVVYEYAPIQFLQLRAGARFNDGIPQNDLQNARSYFLELHGFF